jgi:hypothetical protein
MLLIAFHPLNGFVFIPDERLEMVVSWIFRSTGQRVPHPGLDDDVFRPS